MSAEIADHQENFGKIFESFEFWPEITNGATIIDLGCGGGILTRKLALKYPNAKFIGMDLRSDVIEVAKQRAAALKIKNADFVVGDACNSSGLNLGKADGIFCRFLMEDLPNPLLTLTSMYEALKSGGWVCACERLNSFSKVYPESKAIDQAWTAIYKYFEKEFGAHPGIAANLPKHFEKVGFKDMKSQGYSYVVSRKSSEETFKWYIGVASGMIEGMAEKLVKADFITDVTVKAALADYKQLLESDNSFILEAAICVSGIK